jgi:integrase/recombinase XerD
MSENPPSFLIPTAPAGVPLSPEPADAPPLRAQIAEAYQGWLSKSPSRDTRSNYQRDIAQFLAFLGLPPDHREHLCAIRPQHVSAWRDHLQAQGLTNSSVRRKMTAIRSLFSYLQHYGYTGKNPAHSDLAQAPAVPRDGKTVALSPEDCRRLLEAPLLKITKEDKHGVRQEITLPAGTRDRALLGVLAFTGCRVGELVRLKVKSYKQNGVHRVLEIHGKGGKERLVPLQLEAAERLEAWLDLAGIRDDLDGPLFRPTKAAWGRDRQEFTTKPMTRRAVQKLVDNYVRRLGLDPNVTVHSLRVTALTTAREQGSDIIDLQDFAGHSDPRTTLTYIRNRDRLSKSPAYVLKY